MTRNISLACLLAAAVCLSSCGGSTTSQYEDPPLARPDGLSYPDPNLFIQGVAITPLVPTIRGKPSSYFVVPDLPAGLVMDSDGVISGTPSEPRSPETYLVTAGNAAGDSLFGIRITVLGRFSVGGLISGLTGIGLALTNNGADNLAINANGPFTFARQLPAASSFNVAVATQPSGQTCSVANGSGVLTNSSYGGAVVTCSNNVNKAAGFGSTAVGNTGGIQYLACFYPPTPESIRGYVINPVTGVVTILGELIYRSDMAPAIL
ncbi:MAG TPA: hypothetical protein VFS58_16980, partial [Steroidobacteraceae bacterium]|nr:hypothetical protein [Steroidobacteraceae bacterium]